MNKALFVTSALCALIVSTPSWAGPTHVDIEPLYTVGSGSSDANVANSSVYVVDSDPSDAFYSGVGDLIIGIGGAHYRCTSSLLNGGTHILTAAHCVTDSNGNFLTGTTAQVSFAGGTVIESISNFSVHPDWTGNLNNSGDIAVLELSNPVTDPTVQQYGLYTGTDEIGQVVTKAGYGLSGTGVTGDVLASGTLRVGNNTYDAHGRMLPRSWRFKNSQLFYDFDFGNTYDTFGDALGFDSGHFGEMEVMSGSGDSGGPSFINNLIAGVTSFGFRLSAYDYDATLNSSFGELAGDTRVSSFSSWINGVLGGDSGGGGKGGGKGGGGKGGGKKPKSAQANPVPAPGALWLTMFGLALIGTSRWRRR